MNDLVPIQYNTDQPTVSARELHQFLEIATRFKDWFPRMCEYGFEAGFDFNPLKNEQVQNEGERTVSRMVIDYQLTIPMAKELCMIQRTERGKLARQYFIKIEEAWNTPEMVMARALKLADQQLISLQKRNAALAVQNEVMRPKLSVGTITAESGVIADLAITTAKIAVGAVTTALIETGAVKTAQIADGSITDAKIVGLTANKITAGTIDAANINVINLNADNLTVGTINGQRIGDGAITAEKLASGAVTEEKIAHGVITSEHLADGSVTSDKIAAGSIKESQVNWSTHLLF